FWDQPEARLTLFFLFLLLRGGKSDPRAHDRADHGPEPRHDSPGRATNERARNCAVLIGPSFGPVPHANGLCFVVHVASSLKKQLGYPPHRRDITRPLLHGRTTTTPAGQQPEGGIPV